MGEYMCDFQTMCSRGRLHWDARPCGRFGSEICLVFAAAIAMIAGGCDQEVGPSYVAELPHVGEVQTLAPPAAPAAWSLSSGRYVTVAAFEGWVDPANGTWHIAMIAPDEEAEGPWRTVAQPMWCALESGGGGEVSIASVETPVAMLPGELPLPTACEGPGINSAPFEFFGALCGAVRVSSLLADETLENVYAEIFEFTGTDQQIGYRAPLGTGAEVPNEDYPLSQQYGLWSYGDISPGESVDVVWTFRNNEPGGTEFRFAGRLVHEVRECTPDRGPNGIDDDCDGVIDNGCGIFEGGEACVVDADCFSGECETVQVDPDCVGPTCATERRCTGACPAGLFGAVCDQACPGGAATPCSGNGTCDDGIDGTGLCTCDAGYAGADCSETCPGGVTCSGNGVCDTSGPTPTCACDPIAEAHGLDCAMTCNDGEQNGDEEGVDCGGPCAAPCAAGPLPNLQTGAFHNCGQRSDGTILCWGRNDFNQLNVPTLPAGVGWTSLSTGYYHACAQRTDGQVDCWGGYGNSAAIPSLPAGVQWTAIASGFVHSCGLATDGALRCWGTNQAGSVNSVPSLPASGSWTRVQTTARQTCTWTTEGTTQCLGSSTSGSLPLPVLPDGVSWVDIQGGTQHMCGLDSEGVVRCWGSNATGQTDVPALPPGVTWTQLSSHWVHSCGLGSDNHIRCWGNPTSGKTFVPALPPGLHWTDVHAGEAHSCGRRSDGVWQCWGLDTWGQSTVPAALYD